MSRESMKQDVEDAIGVLFGDTSVFPAETKEDLEEIIGNVQTMIDTLE